MTKTKKCFLVFGILISLSLTACQSGDTGTPAHEVEPVQQQTDCPSVSLEDARAILSKMNRDDRVQLQKECLGSDGSCFETLGKAIESQQQYAGPDVLFALRSELTSI